MKKNNEVLVFENKNEFWTTSLDVADKFDKKHGDVLELIRELDCSIEFSQRNFTPSNYVKRGKEYPCFNISRDGLAFLAMGFTGKKAAAWKEKYIKVFNYLERLNKTLLKQQANEAYVKIRTGSKVIRLEQTDVIKVFVEYATNQGSTKAKMYYANITKMENKALFFLIEGLQKPKNLRDLLNTFQLFQLGAADKLIADALQEGMNKNMHYKDIYQFAKMKLEHFANLIGASAVGVIEGDNNALLIN